MIAGVRESSTFWMMCWLQAPESSCCSDFRPHEPRFERPVRLEQRDRGPLHRKDLEEVVHDAREHLFDLERAGEALPGLDEEREPVLLERLVRASGRASSRIALELGARRRDGRRTGRPSRGIGERQGRDHSGLAVAPDDADARRPDLHLAPARERGDGDLLAADPDAVRGVEIVDFDARAAVPTTRQWRRETERSGTMMSAVGSRPITSSDPTPSSCRPLSLLPRTI